MLPCSPRRVLFRCFPLLQRGSLILTVGRGLGTLVARVLKFERLCCQSDIAGDASRKGLEKWMGLL
jgi:hypothetical protein